MSSLARWRTTHRMCMASLRVFLRDVGAGLLDLGHNSLALVGLCVVGTMLFASAQTELRSTIERQALEWLKDRHEATDGFSRIESADPGAIDRATAADPKSLPRQQAAVAQWLSRRYRVAPEPVSRLVQEAWAVGQRQGIEPTLILAIMAIESSFNPFAQSSVGAQGLMQVMTRVHDDKYLRYGGARAAFDPLSNLRVGALVLRECIERAGSLEAGLKFYVGAANLPDDGGYAAKVMGEQELLKRVVQGKSVSPTAVPVLIAPSPLTTSAPRAVPAEAATPLPPAEAGSAPEAAPASGGERVALM